jgi:Uma2 family endonuclease
MAVKAAVSSKEFLAMSFPGLEPELIDGEIRERAMPSYLHGEIQGLLFGVLRAAGFSASIELRVPLGERVRVVDVAAYRQRPVERYPTNPAEIAIEVLSPDDRMHDVIEKCREYSTWGVPHIWLVDPELQALYVYQKGSLQNVSALELPERKLRITMGDLVAA